MISGTLPLILAVAAPQANGAAGVDAGQIDASQPVRLSASELFRFADQLDNEGNVEGAAQVLEALTKDPDIEIRSEARFRLAMLRMRQSRFDAAAIQLRRILVEKPDAQNVRFELAHALEMSGDEGGARRELRRLRAGTLPEDVARYIDRYSANLQARKPFGGTFRFSIIPDSNINRATSLRTLDTVIAPLQLDDDARAQSGVGISPSVQSYAKQQLADGLNLVARASADATLYTKGEFNDISANGLLGLEYRGPRDVIRPSVGRSWRWYGGSPYATTDLATVSWNHIAGPRTQIGAEVTAGYADYQANDLQDGMLYQAGASLDRAFSETAGATLSLSFLRQDARDPGYANTSGGAKVLGWLDFGEVTLFASAELRKLEADARLNLFTEVRSEWFQSYLVSGSLSKFDLAGFSPTLTLRYENNSSTVDLYAYSRLSLEAGITRIF